MDQQDYITINQKPNKIIKLLGKGKGGYSYLVTNGKTEYVCKQIHHEPCSYYTFGNKLEAELRDYQKLKDLGIPLPTLLEVDDTTERLLKDYIDGPMVYTLVLEERMQETYITQMQNLCAVLYAAGLNIDYFPTNFIVQNDQLVYIDYECNAYMEEWNFENWGIQYWSKTKAFLQYVKEHTS
jgi:Mn2+-dependent serine/threonine protein kinase